MSTSWKRRGQNRRAGLVEVPREARGVSGGGPESSGELLQG